MNCRMRWDAKPRPLALKASTLTPTPRPVGSIELNFTNNKNLNNDSVIN